MEHVISEGCLGPLGEVIIKFSLYVRLVRLPGVFQPQSRIRPQTGPWDPWVSIGEIIPPTAQTKTQKIVFVEGRAVENLVEGFWRIPEGFCYPRAYGFLLQKYYNPWKTLAHPREFLLQK